MVQGAVRTRDCERDGAKHASAEFAPTGAASFIGRNPALWPKANLTRAMPDIDIQSGHLQA
jgi:hypothetical protein